MKDKYAPELEEEVIGILKRSVFDFLFEKPESLQSIFQDEKLLRQLFDYKLSRWEFDEVEILTSLVLVWDKNYPDIRADLRNELMDILLNLYNPGNYDLMLIKLASMKQEKQAEFKRIMQPVVENWNQVDAFNYFNIRSLFDVKDPLEAEKMIMDSFPYRMEDTSIEHAWYHLEIGINLYQHNELEKAKEHILQAYQIAEDEPSINNYLGLIYYKHEEYSRALYFFNEAIEKNKDTKEVVYIGNAGDAYKNLGEYQQAIKKYEACLQVMPHDKRYRQSMAECHNSIGNSFYEKLEYKKAGKYYVKAIYYDNDYAVYHSNAGLAYRYTQQYEKSKGKFEDALQRTDYLPDQAKYNNYIGVLFHEQEKYNEAIQYYEKAIALDPKNPQYLRNKANAYDWLGEFNKAIDWYQLASEQEEKTQEKAKDYNYMGVLLHKLYKYQDALTYYDKALKLAPENALFFRNKASAFNLLGKYEEAITAYQAAVQYETDKIEKAKDYNSMGLIYSNQFKDKMALSCYQKAFAQDANTWVYAANIGYSYRYLHKWKKAVEFYIKAIQIDPAVAQNYYDYGNVLLEMNKKCEAKAQFNKAHELEPLNNDYKTAFENTEC